MLALVIVISVFISFIIANPAITILHELGHALAHLILTKTKRVDIYIGSYGKKSPINFRIGKLYFHIIFAVLKGGMCGSTTADKSYLKRIIILLAGPFFSFIAVCLFCLGVFNSELHGAVKLYFFALMIWTTNSLYISLKPSAITETLDSDGKQILFVLRLKKHYADYIAALKAYHSRQYELAAEKFAIVVKLVTYDRKILRYLIDSLQRAGFLENAEPYLLQLQECDELKIDEMLFYGYILAVGGHFIAANDVFSKVLKKSPDNIIALCNLGYGLALSGDLASATVQLEKALQYDEDCAAAYSVLGYIEIEKDNLENGRLLVEKSVGMDPTYAYSYRHLAYYYLKTGDKEKARLNLNHAAFMDPRIDLKPLINELES